jgi:hypothetical protein
MGNPKVQDKFVLTVYMYVFVFDFVFVVQHTKLPIHCMQKFLK